ncbi:MAG: hypothetical protein R3F49_25055 [Planctomycetota bacterium]
MQSSSFLLFAGAALCGLSSAQIRLVELTTINLNSTSNSANLEYIGSNASAVAWDGTNLWVAGYNGGAPGNDVGIVEVSNALTTPTLGTSFGRISTPNLRGYTGLDVANGRLAAAYDNGGSDPLGYTAWDTANNSLVWSRAGRGSCGIGFDPGFPSGNPALGSGVGYTAFGSGRRALYDAANGNDIYTLANGMIILVTSVGTFWRDMDFDDNTGDIYLRAGNHLLRWTRTGDNGVGTAIPLYTPAMNSDFVSGHNVAYMDTPGLDYVIYNRRDGSGPMQDFFQQVFVVRPDGTPVNVDWGSFSPATGIGYYDFSWHAPSNTLALLDFANRNVHIFEFDTGLGTNYCAANTNSTGAIAKVRADGSPVASANLFTLGASDMPTNAFAFFLAGRTQGFVANPGGSAGNLCLTGSIGRYVGPGQIQNSGAAGSVSLAIDLTTIPQPTGSVAVMAGDTWNFQCWFRDFASGSATSNFTNGLEVTFQ